MAQNQILSDDRGMLYVVATPIGNLGDITLRALEVLKLVDAIAAEDTRHSGMLLKHFGIKKPLVSFHEHNEAMRTAQLIERLAAGENIALVTDAGMPGLSDRTSDPRVHSTKSAVYCCSRSLLDSNCARRFRIFHGKILLQRLFAPKKRGTRARVTRGRRAR